MALGTVSMFDLFWHLRGSVTLNNVASKEAALDGLETLLEKQRKDVSERGTDHLAFNTPLWKNPVGPNWLAMVIYDRGSFWIEEDLGEITMRYDLRSLHGMVFCLFGAPMFFSIGIVGGGLATALKNAAAIALLYGMNVLFSLARVPRVIRKAVRDG